MSPTAARANLDQLDRIGYDGHFSVYAAEHCDLHPRSANQVRTAVGLAANWSYMLSHADGGVSIEGGDEAGHRLRWTIHVPADQLECLPDHLQTAIISARNAESTPTPEGAEG